MSELSKNINEFFKYSTKAEIEKVKAQLCLDEHQEEVLDLFYLKHKSINFIGHKLGFSEAKIKSDLSTLRKKISRLYAK